MASRPLDRTSARDPTGGRLQEAATSTLGLRVRDLPLTQDRIVAAAGA
jgi:hypothetical protein